MRRCIECHAVASLPTCVAPPFLDGSVSLAATDSPAVYRRSALPAARSRERHAPCSRRARPRAARGTAPRLPIRRRACPDPFLAEPTAMNRLSAAPSPPAVRRCRRPRRAAASCEMPTPLEPPQCLLAPQHYEPNYAYPLVVWLHGAGGDERELQHGHAAGQPAELCRAWASAARPRRPRGFRLAANGRRDRSPPSSAIADAVGQARERFNVHRRADFPGRLRARRHDGLAPGAAQSRALRRRRLRSAGRFPRGMRRWPGLRSSPARGCSSRTAAIRRPIQSTAFARSCRCFMPPACASRCGSIPASDELTTQMLHDLDVWLMEQVTGVGSGRGARDAAVPSEWN